MKQHLFLPIVATFLISQLLVSCGNEEQLAPTGNSSSEATKNALHSAIQVRTATAQKMVMNSQLELRGIVEAYRKATVAAEIGARVKKRDIEPGDLVEAGQTMLQLDNVKAANTLNERKAQRNSQKVELASAISELARGKELIAKAFISKDQLEDLQFKADRARAQIQASEAAVANAASTLGDTDIKAPFSGTAEIVHVQEGDFLSPGTAAVTLADFSKLRLISGVSSTNAALLSVGQELAISFETLSGVHSTGEVKSIGRIADRTTGSYPLEVWLDGTALPEVREGMVAILSTNVENAENDATATQSLTVPKSAVFRQKGRTMLYVVEASVAKLLEVSTGRSSEKHVEILSGLSEGQQVVIDGQFALRDGANVALIQ